MNNFLEHIETEFEAGKILTKGMLQAMYDFPRDIVNIKTANWSDGILFGLELERSENHIFLSPGVIKWESRLYFLKEKLDVSELMRGCDEGKSYHFCLIAQETRIENGIQRFNLNIVVKDKSEGFSLAGFLYREGFFPKTDYEKPEDLMSDNFFKILHIPRSAPNEPAPMPAVLKVFAKALLKISYTSDEAIFLARALNGDMVTMDYLRAMVLKKCKPESFDKVFDSFQEILKKREEKKADMPEKDTEFDANEEFRD
jgi:hypothetical protein